MLETIMEPVREYRFELNLSMVARAGLWLALDRLLARLRADISDAAQTRPIPL
jgi:hypothetical protein